MAATITFRPDAKTAAQIDDLLSLYPDRTSLILAAVDALHGLHFPGKHPPPPRVVGFTPRILAEATVCAETERWMDPGETAYVAVWSDGRVGAVFSRQALEADGIL